MQETKKSKLWIVFAIPAVMLFMVVYIMFDSSHDQLAGEQSGDEQSAGEPGVENVLMSAGDYLEQARSYNDAEDFDSAINILLTGSMSLEDNTDILPLLTDTYIRKAKGFESSDDYEKAAKILREGYILTERDELLKMHLTDDLLVVADKKAKRIEYGKSLEIYNDLLELDKDNTKVQEGLADCLNSYMKMLMSEKRYDDIRTIAEIYKDTATGANFNSHLEQIEKIEKIKAENDAFMETVYDAMEKADYQELQDLYASTETKAMIRRMTEEDYVYYPDDTDGMSGKGVGLYDSTGSFYFFVGDYIDGKREGEGALFKNEDDGYRWFSGQWVNDVPNGPCELKTKAKYEKSNESYRTALKGTMKDGLLEGEVKETVTDNSGTYNLTFHVSGGVPTEDKTDGYLAIYRKYYNEPFSLPEDCYIYAYNYNTAGTRFAYVSIYKGQSIYVF